MHIVGMFFFLGKYPFNHTPRGGVDILKKVNHLPIVFARNQFSPSTYWEVERMAQTQ